jgi:hypothetical protein
LIISGNAGLVKSGKEKEGNPDKWVSCFPVPHVPLNVYPVVVCISIQDFHLFILRSLLSAIEFPEPAFFSFGLPNLLDF